MNPLEWTPAYAVGVEKLDEEHRRLFEIINQFAEIADAPASAQRIVAIIAQLKDYAQSHFDGEELYMEKIGYPFLAEHRRQHGAFIESVEVQARRVREGHLVLAVTLYSFLNDWIRNHILVTDQKYHSWANTRV